MTQRPFLFVHAAQVDCCSTAWIVTDSGEGLREHFPHLYQEGKEAKSTGRKGSALMGKDERAFTFNCIGFPLWKVLGYPNLLK